MRAPRAGRLPGLSVIVAVLLFSLSSLAQAAIFVVTKTADTNDGTCDSDCSLREAIIAANANAGADVITLPAGHYTLTIAGTNEDAGATGDLDIVGDLTINGAGASTTIVDGGGIDRVFHIVSAFTVIFNDLQIFNGFLPFANGGGLLNEGTATLNNCIVGENATPNGDGGGIYNDDTMTISGGVIAENAATNGDGGGIYDNGVSITITNTTIAANLAPGGDGAGVYFNGVDATMSQSAIFGNSASGGDGGGIYANGNTLNMTNCTIQGNDAFDGGGIFVNGNTATLTAVTIASNSATNTGGGIQVSSVPQLTGTIIANNTGGNCSGNVTDSGTNLQFPGTTCSGSIPSADPLLGPLADNGGPTQTMALGVGSPAIDANTESCPPPAVDQRGIARPQSAACDIGAFELVPGGGPTPTPTATPAGVPTATATPAGVPTVTATPAGPTPTRGPGPVTPVPTLSGDLLAVLALALALVAVLVMRKSG
jgi:CSLREA domain-containing protein